MQDMIVILWIQIYKSAGADQTFNMQAGRVLQTDLRNKESFVLVTGYLEGTDGRKMSKSWGERYMA